MHDEGDEIALLSSDDLEAATTDIAEDESSSSWLPGNRNNHRRNRAMSSEFPEALKLPLRRTLIECLCLYSFGLSIETLCRFIIEPAQQGFFCNDLSIRLHKDHSIVNGFGLAAFVYICSFLPILLTELYRLTKYDPDVCYSVLERGYDKMTRLAIRVVIFYGYFQVAIVLTWALTTVTKFSIGRPRPYFLEACKPNVDLNACYSTSQFIANYTCTGDPWDVQEARLSFFSGHSSLSLSSATYAVLYLQARVPQTLISRLFVPFLQLICFSFGLFIAYSRVVDHSHHPTDVLCGVIVGIIVSILVAKYVARLFDPQTEHSSPRKTKSDTETNESYIV